ncbi:MAG: VOC family protein [Nitrososphaeria archaeon]
MEKLPLQRIVEVAFLTSNIDKCAEFYNKLGIEYPEIDKNKVQFAEVGEQLFGFSDQDRGFFTGYNEEFIKAPLHIAFEIPFDSIDECIEFLRLKNVTCSPKVENSPGFHGVTRSISVYFKDPAGNIIELWAPFRS